MPFALRVAFRASQPVRVQRCSSGTWPIALLLAWCGACGTDAVGIDACREIETARCEAAAQCGLIEDAQACQKYYDGHCLHGTLLPEAPRAVQVRRCVTAIRAAGDCADTQGKQTHPDECRGDNAEPLESSDARRVCEIVEEPERAQDCAFLAPRDEDDEDDEDDETPAQDAAPAAEEPTETPAEGTPDAAAKDAG